MKTYLAGPMSGLPGLNFAAFHSRAAELRAIGKTVVNPAEINPDAKLEWHQCMRADIAQLVTCDAIEMLPGWEDSRGARLEHHIAERLGMEIHFAPVPVSELQRLRGEAGVLRGLLRECAGVIDTLVDDSDEDTEPLSTLRDKAMNAVRSVSP
jgi:hypothetical protein